MAPGTAADRVLLTFATSPGPAPVGPARPEAVLEAAEPPFVHGGSGQPLVVAGDRFVRLTLRNMAIVNDAGQPFYGGPTEFGPNGTVIRQVVESEAYEGVVTWIVGVAGNLSCVSLTRSTDGMSVAIDLSAG